MRKTLNYGAESKKRPKIILLIIFVGFISFLSVSSEIIPILNTSFKDINVSKAEKEIISHLNQMRDIPLKESEIKINLNRTRRFDMKSSHTVIEFEENGKVRTLIISQQKFKDKFT